MTQLDQAISPVMAPPLPLPLVTVNTTEGLPLPTGMGPFLIYVSIQTVAGKSKPVFSLSSDTSSASTWYTSITWTAVAGTGLTNMLFSYVTSSDYTIEGFISRSNALTFVNMRSNSANATGSCVVVPKTQQNYAFCVNFTVGSQSSQCEDPHIVVTPPGSNDE
ncbi:MAG TPA: hypothetical protein VFP84_03900 [Kofleriaceae bacterium]|nr:hypothetical protein [Kofleriaceae bacterium]